MAAKRLKRAVCSAAIAAGWVSMAPAATYTSDTGGSWSANWSGPVPNAVGEIADFTTLDLTADATVTLDGDRIVSTISFGDMIASGHAWTLAPGSPTNSKLTLTPATSNGAGVINVNAGTTAVFAATLSPTHPYKLQGGGTLRLDAAPAFRKNLDIAAGTTLDLNTNVGVNALTGGGAITNSQGTLRTLTINAITSGAQTNGVNDVSQSGTYSGDISGNIAIFRSNGANTQTFSGSNSYTGATTLQGGVLVLNSSTALGSTVGDTVVLAGRLQLGNGITISGETVTLSGGSPASGVANSGLLYVPDNLSGGWAGTIRLNNSTIAIYNRIGSDGTLTISGAIQDAVGRVGNVEYITGGGSDRIVLSAVGSYTGATQVVRGQVHLAGGDDRLPMGTVLNVLSAGGTDTATFDLDGFNQTLAGLTRTGSGTGTATVTNTGSLSILTLDQSADLTFGPGSGGGASIISGNITLVKRGAGVLTLGSANTYAGSTEINEGTVKLGAIGVIPDASDVELGGGTLQTAGGTEQAGTLKLSAGVSRIDLVGDSVLSFADSSTVAWAEGASLEVLNWDSQADQLLFGSGGLTTQQLATIWFVDPAGDSNPAAGTRYGAQMMGSGEVIAAVPEPGVGGAMAVAGVALLRRRRRS